jgi:hypothetical protein
MQARATLATADDGQVAGPCLAGAFPVDDNRDAGSEVRLADEQLAAALQLDDDRLVGRG